MSALNDSIVRLYDSVFNRAPDAGGLADWNAAADAGMTLHEIAAYFVVSPEFQATYGQPDNLAFVQSLYQNILDRPGEQAGVDAWAAQLNSGAQDRASVTIGFSESAEHISHMQAPEVPSVIFGTTQGDSIIGTDGPDVIYGFAPDQFGHPSLSISDGGDFILGGGGRDFIRGGGGGDHIEGGAGDDHIEGNFGNDLVDGGAGNDRINGDDGSDVFIGGPGADSMASSAFQEGAGDLDVFRFAAAADANGDQISGFVNSIDFLDFRGLGLVFRGTGPILLGHAQISYETDASPETVFRNRGDAVSTVYLDANGDAAPDATLHVFGQVLTDGNFIL